MWKNIKPNRIFLYGTPVVLFLLLGCDFFSQREPQRVFYIDSAFGDNTNKGTSKDKAWKSFAPIKDIQLNTGVEISLANGSIFSEALVLQNIDAKANKPLIISSYNKSSTPNSEKPFIHVMNKSEALRIENCSNIIVRNIRLSAQKKVKLPLEKEKNKMRCGVLITVSKPGIYSGITLDHLDIQNVFMKEPGFTRHPNEVKTANGKQTYGWGIRVINKQKKAVLKNINIQNSHIQNIGHTGIKLTASKPHAEQYFLQQINISNNTIVGTGGPGIQMGGVQHVHVSQNKVDQSGSNDDSRKWGRGSGLWTWSSENVLIEHNRFTNANGPGDSAGAHIDFNCKHIILQYNFSANNAGGFCEILGNNYNCAYRYNISVNDGFRIKGRNNAFQEGKLFWLSGYTGKNPRTGPFNSYFYNNTMYVDASINTKIAIDKGAKGVLIANNIFHIKGKSQLVKGDQYTPEKASNSTVQNMLFTNNLFFHDSSWPIELVKSENLFMGDPEFIKEQGVLSIHYTPQKKSLVKNKGILIPKLPNDSIGLLEGMHPKKDILGNNIDGLPDLGAIEITN